MTRKLTILHTEASKGWGGQEIRILDESDGMRRRGHDVQIAAVGGSPLADAAKKRGIPLHEMPIDKRSMGSLAALRRTIREIDPDVVVTHSSTDSWVTAMACLFRRRPAIVRVRHLGFQVASGLVNRWLYGRVPVHVVTTGEATRNMLVNTLRLDPAHVTSIPTGIDTDRYKPGDGMQARTQTGLIAKNFVIGIVATLRVGKGHRFLVSALEDPRLKDATLVIVGDGPQEENLRAQATELGVADRVVFAGRQQDVVPWLQSFDAFALPSTAIEGAPQAVMQAMATGVPTVVTPVGAIPELVQDGKSGLFVNVSDAASLADTFSLIQADPALAGRLANEARAFAEAKCTIAHMLDMMEDVLQKAAPPRG
jgi:glycosyltransferase involved in cell wall biosynthesis